MSSSSSMRQTNGLFGSIKRTSSLLGRADLALLSLLMHLRTRANAYSPADSIVRIQFVQVPYRRHRHASNHRGTELSHRVSPSPRPCPPPLPAPAAAVGRDGGLGRADRDSRSA